MIVREADSGDVPWIEGCLPDLAREYGTKLPFVGDPCSVHEKLLYASASGTLLIAEDEQGQPCGFLAGLNMPHPYNSDIKVAACALWYVTPSARMSRAGGDLIETWVDKAKGSGADWILLPVGVNCPVSEESLTRWGFSLRERTYHMEVV